MKKYLPCQDSNQGLFHQQSSTIPTELQKPSFSGWWKILYNAADLGPVLVDTYYGHVFRAQTPS